MSDYNISANITANTKGYEAGINKVQKTTKSFSASLSKVIQGLGKNGLVGAMGSIGLASAGLTATLGSVVKIAKQVSQAIGECTEAYKKQLKAERSLDTAIKNSPILNETASKNLKEFASQIQKTSNMGDEELLPMMSQLVAAGRDESEIMKIIQTATDMAATGTISFDTAVTQLNATLNGNVGRLGQQNAELKNLTKEELENGKAVDILAEKYKGMAANTIDSSKQLKNAIGDLKESFGSVFEKAFSPMRKYFAEVIQGWADARKAKQEYEGAVEAVTSGNAEVNQMQAVIEANQKKLEEFDKFVEKKANEFKKSREEIIQNWVMYLNSDDMTKYSAGDLLGPKQAEELEKQNKSLQQRINYLAKVEELNKKLNAQMAEYDQKREDEKAYEESIAQLKQKHLDKIEEQKRKWEATKQITGEEVSLEEQLVFYQEDLISIIQEANGGISTQNQYYKDQMAIIETLSQQIQSMGTTGEEGKTSTEWAKKLRDQLIDRLEAEKEIELDSVSFKEKSVFEKYQIEKRYNDQIMQLYWDRLLEERDEALRSIKGVKNEEEEKARIVEYYQNEISSLVKKYGTKELDLTKKSAKEIIKEWQIKFGSVMQAVSGFVKNLSQMYSKIIGIFKSFNLKNIFNFNPDDALDGLLAFEDKILTFFVETIPKLPAFVSSALESISVLFKTLKLNIDSSKIREFTKGIISAIAKFLPYIVKTGIEIAKELFIGIRDGIKENIPLLFQSLKIVTDAIFDILPDLLVVLGDIMTGIAQAFPQLFEKVIEAIITLLDDHEKVREITAALVKGFVEIFMVLLKNIGPLLDALLPAIGTLIIEIIKAIPSMLWGMVQAVSEAVGAIAKWVVNLVIDGINLLLDGISAAWTWIPGTKGIPHIPHFASGTDNAQRGLALVGEAGPELVNFRGGEQVLNNRNTQKALAGIGNSGNTFNVTFNNTQDTTAFAMMQQLKQYQRNMAFNSVM